jgi:Kef-type K+ transport system membrane component KefB
MIGIVAITSTVVPFSMGVPFAYFLAQHFPGMVGEHGTALTFALAIGVAVSVTALPVLSAILHDMKEQESGWGRFILTIAVAHDAILWINLTALLLLAGAEEGHGGPGPIGAIVFTIGFFVVMVTIVRNGLSKLVSSAWWKHLPDGMKLALQGVYFLAGAIVTQLIGIHYLIGAVVCGAVWPDHNRKPILKRMETFVIALVLPLFFAAAGIRTRFDLGSAEVWVIFFSMTTIAFIGQFLGTSLVLKALGQKWSFALSVGTMLTCKGIAELVVLGLLNAEGIISNEAYAGMVLMALASTASTKFGVMMIRRIFGHHHLPGSHM